MIVIMQSTQEKANSQKTKVNTTKIIMRMEINFALGKNGGHTSSSLGGRSIVMVRQAGRQTKCLQFLKFDNFNSKVRLGWH